MLTSAFLEALVALVALGAFEPFAADEGSAGVSFGALGVFFAI